MTCELPQIRDDRIRVASVAEQEFHQLGRPLLNCHCLFQSGPGTVCSVTGPIKPDGTNGDCAL